MGTFKDQRGVVIVVVLLVVVILTVSVTEFLHATWINYALAADFRDDTKALQAARAGVRAARAILLEDAKQAGNVDSYNEQWAQPSIPIPFYNSFAFVTVQDEGGKFNLNDLVETQSGLPSGPPDQKLFPAFQRLLDELDVDPSVAEAIKDWLDTDDEGYHEYGVYASLLYPYKCKNGYFDSIDELKMVDGVNAEVYSKLRKFVTVQKYSNRKVNINTAPVEILMSLHENITRVMAEAVVEARSKVDFTKTEEIKNILGFEDDEIWTNISPMIKINSDTYRVNVAVTIGEVTRNAEAIFTARTSSDAKLIYMRIF